MGVKGEVREEVRGEVGVGVRGEVRVGVEVRGEMEGKVRGVGVGSPFFLPLTLTRCSRGGPPNRTSLSLRGPGETSSNPVTVFGVGVWT